MTYKSRINDGLRVNFMSFYMFTTGSAFASGQATHDDGARNSTRFNQKGKALKQITAHFFFTYD